MKWYNRKGMIDFFKQAENLPKVNFVDDALDYLPLVVKFVNKKDKSEARIGVYGYDDIFQSGASGLIKAWHKVDWDVVGKASNNAKTKEEGDKLERKTLINYLSSEIDGTIYRDLMNNAVGVAIPLSQIKKTKAESFVDELFGNWMYNFNLNDMATQNLDFTDMLDEYSLESNMIHRNHDDYNNDGVTFNNAGMKTAVYSYMNPFEVKKLNSKINDVLYVLNDKEREVMKYSFGIDYDKSPMKDIANIMDMSVGGIEKIKRNAMQKLNSQENKEYLKDFL